MKLFSKSIRYELIILAKTERIGVTVDGICRRSPLSSRRTVSSFKFNIKQTQSLKFRFDTRRPTVSNWLEHYFKPLKIPLIILSTKRWAFVDQPRPNWSIVFK